MSERDKTTILLDRELAADAAKALGTRKITETIHQALSHVVRERELRRVALESIEISEKMGHDALEELRREAWSRPEHVT